MSLATPLVDGMVVSRRAIGPLLRQTALNMCRYAAHKILTMEVHLQSVCFGPPGPRTHIIWYGIKKQKSKKHHDFYYFVTFCCLFIYEN
jgi:hypothetical protein